MANTTTYLGLSTIDFLGGDNVTIDNEIGQSGGTASRPTTVVYVGKKYFDTSLGKPVFVKTVGAYEVDTLTVTTGATASGNITITLNGVNTNVAVAAGDSTSTVATKIANTSFSGWTTSVSTNAVAFTKNTQTTNTAPAFSDTGTTGTAASFTVTTAGKAPSWVDATGATV